jgi:hypothetical protein
MKAGFQDEHWIDAAGNPAGGCSWGTGFAISWQNGPLERGPDRRQPNGAFVEDLIEVVLNRLAFYQNSPFACEQNRRAMHSLEGALAALSARTVEREARGVEGTHQP